MKIAIHHRKGSFSERWIEYCQQHSIEYKLVNAYQTNIVEQVKGCDAFMWHHHHADYRDALFAKQLIYSLESAGIKCYPNSHTTWHFDDKVGQKYLLESVGAPLVPSYVFYTKQEALAWVEKTQFPKVFKLRGGAGSSNVRLVKTKTQAKKIISKAFGSGFSAYNRFGALKESLVKYLHGKGTLKEVAKKTLQLFTSTTYGKMHSREKGYVYFQEFIPNNTFDLRVVVIVDKAMGEKRYVRKGDFRASGSGEFEYVSLPNDVLNVAFNTAKSLKMQSVAFDFIFRDNEPLIVEMSYGFGTHGISHCNGYYTNDLQWHEERPDFCGWMIENMIHNCQNG